MPPALPRAVEFVINPALTVGYNINPGNGNWTEISGSGSAGGISATAGLSQFPQLALDNGGGISVVWQESLPAAPPVTSTQIYMKRSVALGAWTGMLTVAALLSRPPSLALKVKLSGPL